MDEQGTKRQTTGTLPPKVGALPPVVDKYRNPISRGLQLYPLLPVRTDCKHAAVRRLKYVLDPDNHPMVLDIDTNGLMRLVLVRYPSGREETLMSGCLSMETPHLVFTASWDAWAWGVQELFDWTKVAMAHKIKALDDQKRDLREDGREVAHDVANIQRAYGKRRANAILAEAGGKVPGGRNSFDFRSAVRFHRDNMNESYHSLG
jgi:hypothetical protein